MASRRMGRLPHEINNFPRTAQAQFELEQRKIVADASFAS